jgi:ribose transport system permease protein
MKRSRFNNYIILLVLISLIAFFSIANFKAFLTVDNFFTVIRQVSMLGIAAVGMTFVMLVGGLDLSVGTMQGLTGVVVASMMVNFGVNPIIAIVVTLGVGILVGYANGLIVTKLKVTPFITTLSMMTIIKGIAFTYTGGFPIYGFNESFQILGQGYVLSIIPIPVVIMVAIFIIGWILLNNTYIGRYLYSVGGNEEASRLSGINVKKVKMTAYMSSGLTAAIAGVILCSRLNSGQPNAGAGFEFDVITAVVLGGVSLSGGVGRLQSVFIGVLIMGVLSNGMTIISINEYIQWIVKGLVLIIAVALDEMGRKKSRLSVGA